METCRAAPARTPQGSSSVTTTTQSSGGQEQELQCVEHLSPCELQDLQWRVLQRLQRSGQLQQKLQEAVECLTQDAQQLMELDLGEEAARQQLEQVRQQQVLVRESEHTHRCAAI